MSKCKKEKLHNYFKGRHHHNFCGECGMRLRFMGIITNLLLFMNKD